MNGRRYRRRSHDYNRRSTDLNLMPLTISAHFPDLARLLDEWHELTSQLDALRPKIIAELDKADEANKAGLDPVEGCPDCDAGLWHREWPGGPRTGEF